jgi:malate synthase
MNEQIAKIAKQAGLTLSVDQQVAFQRAAELIVKECANISNQAEKQCQHPGTEIKKHFGVEE